MLTTPPSISTPQNTPATAAPISSHAQQPGVASIKEGMYFDLVLFYKEPVMNQSITLGTTL